jgi:hypothetical protein
MAKTTVKSYIESRLDFFKARRDKAKRKYERELWKYKQIDAPTPEDRRKLDEATEEYNYYIDVVILLERKPCRIGEGEETKNDND